MLGWFTKSSPRSTGKRFRITRADLEKSAKDAFSAGLVAASDNLVQTIANGRVEFDGKVVWAAGLFVVVQFLRRLFQNNDPQAPVFQPPYQPPYPYWQAPPSPSSNAPQPPNQWPGN